MAFQLSPGINTSEIDFTTVVPSAILTAGGFAGNFNWGPANEVTTITDEARLVARFSKPDSTNFEYWFSAANFLAYSGNLQVVRAANTTSTFNATANGTGILIENETDYTNNHEGATNTAYGPFAARYAGALGNTVRVSICSSAQAFSSNLTSTDSMRANSLNYLVDSTTVINVNGTADARANLVAGDLISIDNGSSFIRVASVNAIAIVLATALSSNVTLGTAITRRWQYYDQFGVAPGTSTFVADKGGSNDELHVVVIDEDGKYSGTANTVLEKYAFVSKASDAISNDGATNFYKNVINQQSAWVWWMGHQPGATNWGTASSGVTFDAIRSPFSASMSSGADGTIGTSEIITAYGKFLNADDSNISLLVSGPGNLTTAAYLISLAESRKDCMVFLSPPKSTVVNNAGGEATGIVAYRDTLTSSSYASMDSGYKYQYDKYNDVYRYIPLNADIAGLCARTDSDRDPWFSPGGLSRGQVKNVIKLSFNPTKADRDTLYVKGINPVVTFAGEGTVLFGDKTLLNKPSVFDRINVRRLFIVLEKSIAVAARASLFEFNDSFTRAQFVGIVEPFLRTIQGRRGITDYRVICNETNNTPDIIDNNQFVGDIYIKPARSVNFIQLNFVAVRTGVAFEEIVGRI